LEAKLTMSRAWRSVRSTPNSKRRSSIGLAKDLHHHVRFGCARPARLSCGHEQRRRAVALLGSAEQFLRAADVVFANLTADNMLGAEPGRRIIASWSRPPRAKYRPLTKSLTFADEGTAALTTVINHRQSP
jgi:hypothetical protein